MTPQEFAALLDRTLEDARLSRNERRSVADAAAAAGDEPTRAQFRKLAFEKAAAALGGPPAQPVLGWLDDVLRALEPKAGPSTAPAVGEAAEAHFSPGDDCWRRLVSVLGSAKRTLDVCVFTITDDRITAAILGAHRRGVAVRVLTDNEKAADLGSDVEQLRRAGVPLRIDDSPFHMHHKFALVDGALLLNGSFNWTRSASVNNEENFVITGDARLVTAFSRVFEQLWQKFGR
jgi:cardiolipin hydrolase